MTKGKIRIVIGLILIFLQLLSIAGNLKVGIGFRLSFDNIYIFLYDLGVLFFYLLIGIIGVIFLICGLFAYRKSSVVTEENKNNKAVESNIKETQYETINTETQFQATKQKYCIRCGKTVDNKTKKCTECGKQYFRGLRINKRNYAISGFAILLILLIALIIVQYDSINKLEMQVSNLKITKENLEKEINESSQLEKNEEANESISKTEVDENYTPIYIGQFSSMLDLKEEQQRNPDKFVKPVKLSVKGTIIRTESQSIFLVQDANDKDSRGGSDYSGAMAVGVAKKQGVSNEQVERIVANYCRVYMVDDTKNRVLTGDKVNISGVYNHDSFTLANCTVELIN